MSAPMSAPVCPGECPDKVCCRGGLRGGLRGTPYIIGHNGATKTPPAILAVEVDTVNRRGSSGVY
jgi:hypothetical protein